MRNAVMNTKRQDDIIGMHKDLMHEIYVRLYCVNSIGQNINDLPIHVIKESVVLQIRYICELIALSCLNVHGDLVKSTNIMKEYAADKIINKLKSLYKDHYPKPINIHRSPDGVVYFTPFNGEFLTAEDLVRLYWKCGEILHRGSLKKLLSSKNYRENDFNFILNSANNIVNLLKNHVIFLMTGESILCSITKDNICTAFAQPLPPCS